MLWQSVQAMQIGIGALLLLATTTMAAQEPARAGAVSPVVVDDAVLGGIAGPGTGVDIVAVNVVPTNFLNSEPVMIGQGTKLKCVVYEYHPAGTNPDPVHWKGRIEAEGKVLATFNSEAALLKEHVFDGDATMTSWSYDYNADWTPAKSGWNTTRCVVDIVNAVPEINETNNSKNSKAWVDEPKSAWLGDQPPPTAQLPPGGPILVAPTAKLVTQSATIVPAEPQTGQKIQVEAKVRNEGAEPSKAGAGVFGLCTQVAGNPPCPSNLVPFGAPLPSVAPGSTHTATLAPPAEWKAGRYRLVIGTDPVGGEDALELELVVKPSTYGAVPLKEGQVRQQGPPGESRGLNPQPEPPSAVANPRLALPRAQATPANQLFTAPMWNGKRVDLCLVWGDQCGAPAATDFCKRSGYAKTAAWKPAYDIGAQSPTVVLSTGQVCSDASCDGFASITCSK